VSALEPHKSKRGTRDLRNANVTLPIGPREEMDTVKWYNAKKLLRFIDPAHGVELRRFGAFSVDRREARDGHNLRSGASVHVPGKHVPVFRGSGVMVKRISSLGQRTTGMLDLGGPDAVPRVRRAGEVGGAGLVG
jgi:nucleoid DNA-binding protein